jgi:hypothetical protein
MSDTKSLLSDEERRELVKQQRAEIERLTDENRKMNATIAKDAVEIYEKEAENERLRAELDKTTRLVGQSIQWQHDAEIKLLNLRAENERLRALIRPMRMETLR